MGQQITLEMIEARRKKLLEGALDLQTMSDGEKIAEESKKLQQQAEELQAMGMVFEQQELAKAKEQYGVAPPQKTIKVELTDEQRKEVLEETGFRMEVVEFDEGEFFLSKQMPDEHPQRVKIRAIKQARQNLAQDAANADAQAKADAALADIQAIDDPNVKAQLAELQKDPNWMGGMFNE